MRKFSIKAKEAAQKIMKRLHERAVFMLMKPYYLDNKEKQEQWRAQYF